MTIAPPLRCTDSMETCQEDEKTTVHELNATFDRILETTAQDLGHAVRSVYAKAQGILQDTVTLAAGLPPELAQGMFATPGRHQVVMRLSTNAGDILPDAISLPLGLALKVLDVEGERLPGAEGRTRNFVMVNGPVFRAKTTTRFLGNLKMLTGTTDRLEGIKTAMSTVLRGVSSVLEAVGIESLKLQSPGGAPNVDPLGETYCSVTPFRYGDYVAKFAVAPVSPGLTARTGREIGGSEGPDVIHDTLQNGMRVINAGDAPAAGQHQPGMQGTVRALRGVLRPVQPQARSTSRAGRAHEGHRRGARHLVPEPLAALPTTAREAMRMVEMPSDLKKFNVTVRRFDPAAGFAEGTDFVLPVDSPDEEHAVSAAMSNAVAFTRKTKDGAALPIAFACLAVAARQQTA